MTHEDKFATKDRLDTALDAALTRFRLSFYRALFLQAVAIGGLTAVMLKFFS